MIDLILGESASGGQQGRLPRLHAARGRARGFLPASAVKAPVAMPLRNEDLSTNNSDLEPTGPHPTPMYSLHSWLRYAVFFLGAAGFFYALWGAVKSRSYEKRMWDLASGFTLSLYLQIVIGFFLIFGTTNRFFDRTLGLHMVLSMVAAAVAQLTYSANRRRVREERTYWIHVWGIGLAMVLVLAGILVIRDSLFS